VDGFRPPTSRPEDTLQEQVARGRAVLRERYRRARGYLVYFQPFTNTYGTPEQLRHLIEEALACPGMLGIVIGTRPDCLPEPILDLLAWAASRTYLQIELGVQSTHDATLQAMDRGHDWEDSQRAIAALRQRGIRVGAHVILGTPWEPRQSQIAGATRLSQAGIDAVKLHQLQVLKGSRLATLWPKARWRLPGWQAYATLAADFLEALDQRVVVERLFARAPHGLLLAPRWGVSPHRVRAEIIRTLHQRGSRQGSMAGAAARLPRRVAP
jgi:radical SAM protein (TIGR01212 family)